MILLIDIGNSSLKWTMMHGWEILPSSSCSYRSQDIAWDWFDKVIIKPEAIYVISVGSEALELQLTEACRKWWDMTPVRLEATSYCAGVRNGYDKPWTLGVDRWAAMIGACQLTQEGVLVIDCGTACSADVVDAEGRHQGGAIIPGLNLMQQGLVAGTARIGATSDDDETIMLGTSTTGCIQFGVRMAVVGFIERMERQALKWMGERGTVIITGGDAPTLLPLLQSHIRYEKELVFLGMARMVREAGSNLLP